MMPVFSLNPPEFPSLWANAWGQDKHGFWQSLCLNGVNQIMRWIPPGQFQMGSPETEVDRSDDEKLHQVTLTQGYWLADTACSQHLWLAVMGDNPSHFKDNPENPVETISWLDCEQFFQRANKLITGDLNLRFPTEAEWEYACRANTNTVFSWGDSLTTEQANYDGNYPYNQGEKGKYRKQSIAVLNFSANPWGLYQMHGNVWEWCSDWYGGYQSEDERDPQGDSKGQSRVLRGGGCIDYGRYLRSADRFALEPDYRGDLIGFRLAGG